MEALITKSNAERIIKQMDKSEFDIIDFKNDMKFKWFNKGELKQLKAFSMLFSKPDEFFSKYVPLSRNDSKQFVFNSGRSAFHLHEGCEKMLSDFRNILIPEEILKTGRKDEFIAWCKGKAELFEKYPDQFKLRLKINFGLSKDPFVRFDNSGYESFDNYSVAELDQAIDQKILEVQELMEASNLYFEVISVFGIQSFNYKYPSMINLAKLSISVNMDEVIEILKSFELNIKKPLVRLFQHYYRMKNNRDLKFESDILLTLGFNPCSKCCSVRN
jgi:hypothetical protein